MSLEKIAEHIEKETDTKIKKIVIEAQLKANEYTKEADKKVAEILKEAQSKKEIIVEEKRTIENAKIHVERDQIIKKAVSDAFKDSMNNLYSSEKEFSKTPEYQKLMVILIKEAKKRIGENAVLFMNKDDLQVFGKKEKKCKALQKEHVWSLC